jgi:predicted dithiol-disulfide oxidoreductase (DUF899 family)
MGVFCKNDKGEIFHTYSTYAAGSTFCLGPTISST